MAKFNYDYLYQAKVISALLLDQKYFLKVNQILKPEYFQNDQFNFIIKLIYEYFNNYNITPNLDVLYQQIKQLKVTNNQIFIKAFDTIKQHMCDQDISYIKDKTFDFCKKQHIKLAFLKSVDLLQEQDYQSLQKTMTNAFNIGLDTNQGVQLFESIDRRYDKSITLGVPTPWSAINNITQGKLPFGTLNIIAAPPSKGKSHVLLQISANAVKLGYKVIYYTMQLSQDYINKRFDSHILKIAPQLVHLHLDQLKQKLLPYQNLFRCKQYAPNTASIFTIKNHLQQLKKLFNFDPDLIVVDYGDLLQSTLPHTNSYFSIGQNYVDMKRLAMDTHKVIWAASQINKQESNEDIIEMTGMSQSFKKAQISDFAISLSVKLQDVLAKTGRVHVMKNRYGQQGVTFNCTLDTSTSTIQLHQNGSLGSALSKEKQQSRMYEKKQSIKARLQQITQLNNLRNKG